jgi:hypothetical protein
MRTSAPIRRFVSVISDFVMSNKKPQTAEVEVADATLYYVDPDSQLGYSLGQFIVAWGNLEHQLDIGFHVLFHTDATLAMCLYANLGTKAKIDILQSAITMQEEPIGVGRAARARQVLQRIAGLSDQARLPTAHGQVQAYRIEEKGKDWILVRQIARSKPKITVHPSTSRHWKAQANQARKLAAWWRQYVAEIHSRIGHLTLSDLEKICAVDTQDVRSKRTDRRKHPLRRKRALEDLQVTLPKWPRK